MVKGFDYVRQRAVDYSRKEWIQQLAALKARGGFRRHEKGETFGHGPDGLIQFEVYANIPEKK